MDLTSLVLNFTFKISNADVVSLNFYIELEDNFNNLTITQTINILDNFNNNISTETNNTEWKPPKRRFNYTLKDTFDFINKVSKIKLEEGDFVISIDVESLFTNVPIDETIEIIKKLFLE